jgi:hypothetical protein
MTELSLSGMPVLSLGSPMLDSAIWDSSLGPQSGGKSFAELLAILDLRINGSVSLCPVL